MALYHKNKCGNLCGNFTFIVLRDTTYALNHSTMTDKIGEN